MIILFAIKFNHQSLSLFNVFSRSSNSNCMLNNSKKRDETGSETYIQAIEIRIAGDNCLETKEVSLKPCQITKTKKIAIKTLPTISRYILTFFEVFLTKKTIPT